MPYAHNNQISTTPIEGGIEITREQYLEALAGMQVGKIVSIDGGFQVVDPPPEVPEAPEEPAPEPEQPIEPQVPQVVTRFQALGAMMLTPSKHEGFDNLLDEVETIMSDPETPALSRLAWREVLEFKRQSPTILSIAPQVELDDDDLDQLFVLASSIDA